MSGWMTVGAVFGVALDLGNGTMLAKVLKEAEEEGPWLTAFSEGVSPGEAVGGFLFPAISGRDFGGDSTRVFSG